MNLFSSVIFIQVGWALLHFIWQGAVIALVFGLTSLALRRCSARVRYLVACGFFVAMAICPMATWLAIKTDRFTLSSLVADSELSTIRETQVSSKSPTSIESVPSNAQTSSPAIEAKISSNTTVPAEAVSNWLDQLSRSIEPWIPHTVVLWLCGVCALSLRLLLGWVVVVRLRRNVSTLATAVWVQRMEILVSRLRVSTPVKLAESTLVEVPTVIGWLRPMILIPSSAFTGLTTSQLEAILAHELAHIRRHDFLVNLVQSVIEALLFYHPAVWWLSKRIREEREHCCDDLAVSVCDSRSEYIRALAEMESLRSRSSLAMAANGGSLLSRTQRLLQPANDIPCSASWGASLLAIGSLVLMLSLPYWIAQPETAKAKEPLLQETNNTATATGEKPDEGDDGELKVYTHPITVSGRALDEDGQPIADAKIYLISVRADYKRVAETVTDSKGKYEFKNAPLPIEPAQRNSSNHDYGSFEVFGSKPGKAFAWRPRKTYYPKRNDNTYRSSPSQEVPSQFFADDPIELDLVFGESKSIQGQITDESGAPLAGVRIELRRCEKLQSDDLIEQGVVSSHHELESLNQPDDIPGEIKKRVTDSDGRFEFTDVPVECQFWFNTRIRDYAADDFYAATTERELPLLGGWGKIHTKEVLLRFPRTVDVPIKVVFGDTGQPAAKVFTNMHSWSTTNEEGLATLKLAPSTYKNQYLLPARGTRYLVTELEEEVVVTREPPKEPLVLKLKPACELDVTIVDADTGQPIADVDLWMSDTDADRDTGRSEVMFRSFEAPDISHVDRPKSSSEGKLRALVEPGRHRFGVGNALHPSGYKVDRIGQLVDCPASQKIEVTLKLTRIEANAK